MNPSSRPPTYRSIAARAGVSVATVSFALRNDTRISEPVRLRVQAVAEEMGYRPNPLLSAYQASVRAGKPAAFQSTLAWVNDNPNPHYWDQPWLGPMLEAARTRAERLGFLLEEIRLGEFTDDPGETRPLLRALRARGISGVILPLSHRSDITIQAWKGFTVVCIGRNEVSLEEDAVSDIVSHRHHAVQTDDYANMRLAFRKLREAGRTRIGLALSNGVDRLSDKMLTACFLREQMRAAPARKVPILFDPDGGKKVSAWMEKHRVDAVVCLDRRVRAEVERAGYRVPGDVRVAHLNLASDVEGWSGVNPRVDLLGSSAVDIITAHMIRNETGVPPVAKRMVIPGVWVEGGT